MVTRYFLSVVKPMAEPAPAALSWRARMEAEADSRRRLRPGGSDEVLAIGVAAAEFDVEDASPDASGLGADEGGSVDAAALAAEASAVPPPSPTFFPLPFCSPPLVRPAATPLSSSTKV